MKIKKSLATCEPQLITPRGENYDDYVARLSRKLLAAVIDPIQVQVTRTIIQDDAFSLFHKSNTWAIAGDSQGWLLTIEGQNEFALAFGDDLDDLMLHGCSSEDALGEWCA